MHIKVAKDGKFYFLTVGQNNFGNKIHTRVTLFSKYMLDAEVSQIHDLIGWKVFT